MLKLGAVQEKIMDLTSNKKLPPLKTLPHWPRGGALDKSRYPKPFVKDKNLDLHETKVSRDTDEGSNMDISGMNPVQHITHLERSIAFVRAQHSDMLNSLHAEISKLKKENKELNLKIVLTQNPSVNREAHEETSHLPSDTSVHGETRSNHLDNAWSGMAPNSPGTHTKSIEEKNQVDDLKMVFMEDEIKQLKQALREWNNRHFFMAQALEKAEEQKRYLQTAVDRLQYQQQQQAVQNGFTMEKLPADVKPDGVTDASNRAPTLQECELIIRHLRRVTEKQSHELDALKSDLRDVLYSHKWTPDAYLLAKAYVAADDATNGNRLPDISQRRMPEIAYVRDNLTLPTLKQTVGSKTVERGKRTKILQKARLAKDIVPQINIAP